MSNIQPNKRQDFAATLLRFSHLSYSDAGVTNPPQGETIDSAIVNVTASIVIKALIRLNRAWPRQSDVDHGIAYSFALFVMLSLLQELARDGHCVENKDIMLQLAIIVFLNHPLEERGRFMIEGLRIHQEMCGQQDDKAVAWKSLVRVLTVAFVKRHDDPNLRAYDVEALLADHLKLIYDSINS